MANTDWEEAPAGSGSWWETAKKVGQTADDTVRAAANAITFGMADRLAGYAGGEGTDAEVKKSEAARERSPVASVAGDVAGSVALPGFGAARLAARGGGTLAARAGAYGLTCAGTGALQGAGNTYTGELPDYVKNAAIGGALGGTLGAAGGAIFGRGPATPRAQAPTQNELFNAKQAGYGALGRSGARYEQTALAQRGDDIERQLLADRFHWRDSPGTWRAVNEARGQAAPGQLNTGYGGVVDPANIDFIVKGLNRIPKTEATQVDRESARVVKRALNDFIENPPAGAVLPGTEREAARAATLAANARGDYGAYKRVQAFDELANNAANTTGATHSGLNLQNELRKGARTFIKEKGGESPASKAGFIPAEREALRDFVRGNPTTNALRYTSNALGGGGGAVGIGASALGYGGLAGASGLARGQDPETAAAMSATTSVAAPIAGLLLRRAGNRRADAEIQALRDVIARRSPMFNYRQTMQPGTVPGAGSPRAAKGVRDAVALEILKQRGQQTPSGEDEWQ